MLEGIKVLSFTHYLQGPSAAQALADLGADVVKIEACKGAYERGWSGCNTYKNGVSVFYLMANRNQRGPRDLTSSLRKAVKRYTRSYGTKAMTLSLKISAPALWTSLAWDMRSSRK